MGLARDFKIGLLRGMAFYQCRLCQKQSASNKVAGARTNGDFIKLCLFFLIL